MADAAVRYAEALLTAAKKENALAQVAEDLSSLALDFAKSAALFSAPVFPVREQLATVNYVLGDKFHPIIKRFFCLLASMRRLGEIEQIAAVFDRMACKEMGMIDLHLDVFLDETSEVKDKLIQAAGVKGLHDPQNKKNIRLSYKVNKGLLGGFVAECDGLSWDCSLRTRLVDMGKLIRKV
jgi:F-type H+-transporting ATPase subunit delta